MARGAMHAGHGQRPMAVKKEAHRMNPHFAAVLDQPATAETNEALREAALEILRAAGCGGVLVQGSGDSWHVGDGPNEGQIFAVAYSAKNPLTPNDPVYLAHQVVATLRRNGDLPVAGSTLELGADLLAAEGEAEPRTYDEATEEYFAEHPEDAVREAAAPLDGGSEGLSGADDIAEAEAQNAGTWEAFVEKVRGFTDADLIAIEGQPDDIAVEEPQPTDPGGVAYFGDNIHTIKLAKMGRLSQIARAAKEALQAGWTLAEFASLQNLIVRIDRGEAPDDPEARARFMAISERSAAMARVDAYREQREGELEEADRPGIEAFDPEAGWP